MRQKEGFGAIINGQNQMDVKYAVDLIKNDDTKISNYLSSSDKIPISNQKIFKIADGGTDDIANVTVEKIEKIN